MPPYVIFHDATLTALLDLRPRDREEMKQVPGIGQHKLERYGQRFLDVLAELGGGGAPADTRRETRLLLRAGHDSAAIAEQRGLAPTTVYEHLAQGVENGEIGLNEVLDLDPGARGTIEDALLDNGEPVTRLRPVFDALDGEWSFEILKLVRADLRRRAGNAETAPG